MNFQKAEPVKGEYKPGVMLARDPKRAMQEMMDIIDNLHGIIDEETRALESADTKTFLGLQEKKLMAAQAYHDGTTQIISRKEEFADVRDTFRKKLGSREKAFHASTELNMKKLRSMSRGLKRMTNLLMENAREQGKKMQTLGYTASGAIENPEGKKVSIGLNESA
jgi:hypothetical protein